MTKLGIITLQNKCIYLCKTYEIALGKLGGSCEIQWVDTCCKNSVRCVNALGFDTKINFQTLARWNFDSRKYRKFPRPNPNVDNGLK